MNPEILVRPGRDGGLIVTIVVSAIVHLAVIAFLITTPSRFRVPSRPPDSYTVELFSGDAVGGTNLARGALAANKKPAPADEPEAPVVAAEEEAEPEAPVLVEEEAEPEAPVVAAEEEAEPEAPVVAEEEAESEAPVVAEEEAAPEAPVVVAQAEPKPPALVEEEAEPKPEPTASAQRSSGENLDARIARAVAERAAIIDTTRPAEPNDQIDQQIAAAIRRRVAGQVAGASEPASAPARPISYGPGVGTGGTIGDLEYIAYRGQMEARIRAAWAWAGTDRSLVAVVGFNITPAGVIVNVHTVTTSGDPSYDASAERAVLSANPLEPPPVRYRREFWGVELEFRPEEARS